ncbi:hypothetical protein C0995_010726 [Termitomyces sp. Mi166|nr:hypothetical protein C0995_010726 [Termitomyces sp. Mi166\
MLSIANLNIRNFYDNATEFILSHSPTWSPVAHPSESSASSSPSITRHDVPESRSRECAPLHERLDAACHSPTSSLSGLAPFSMRREFDATKTELAKSQAEVTRLEERCHMLEKTLKETREMLRARDAELEKMRQEREKDRMTAERRRSDVGPQTGTPTPSRDLHTRHSSLDMRRTGNPLSNGRSTPIEQERALMLAGSEEERARIRNAELFMTRTDTWSGAQVLQAVHDINSEILQFAASATELCKAQPTASKWRALTHRHIHTLHPHVAESSINDLSDNIFRWSSDIFTVAGCLSYENGSTSSKDGLRLRFGDQVRRIANSVTRLARVTREEIMSTCFDVISVNPNASFDPSNMSDAFGGYVASRGAVIATTELGLRCTTRLRGNESSETHDDVTLEQRTILQPKVVLESVLDVFEPR